MSRLPNTVMYFDDGRSPNLMPFKKPDIVGAAYLRMDHVKVLLRALNGQCVNEAELSEVTKLVEAADGTQRTEPPVPETEGVHQSP